jgi:heme/copper-type cytochrome/quinol oxidase subunit 3
MLMLPDESPTPSAPRTPDYSHTPLRAHVIGMYLFLMSLGMLFFASILGYLLLRYNLFGRTARPPLQMPAGTWFSTGVLLLGSFTIHKAVASVRFEKLRQLNRYLIVTLSLAIVFLIIQVPCLLLILQSHYDLSAQGVGLYGLIFCLVLLHAAHVVGGIIALMIVTYKAGRGAYDHENYMGVRHAALYWHFLDIVWITMFSMFLITG